MDVNFELYKIFYHVAKLKSFSLAAEQLFISQSAISQSIKNLEQKTGCVLFYRRTRNITLTREGELLFKHIEQAYNFIKTGESKLTEIQNMDLGEVRIGVGDTICKHFLISYLQNFIYKYPKIKIQVINRTSSQILNCLKNGLIDLGIVTLPIHDTAVTVEKFICVEDIFVANERFLSLKDRTVYLKELEKYPLLMLEKDSATRRNMDSFLQTQGIQIIPELELESIDLLVEFAKIGLGVAHVLKESAQCAISEEKLFEVKIDSNLPNRKLGIATMKDMPLSPASSQFVDTLKNGFQE